MDGRYGRYDRDDVEWSYHLLIALKMFSVRKIAEYRVALHFLILQNCGQLAKTCPL
jgi:hypothetical protein